jgi:hypothetical protein
MTIVGSAERLDPQPTERETWLTTRACKIRDLRSIGQGRRLRWRRPEMPLGALAAHLGFNRNATYKHC